VPTVEIWWLASRPGLSDLKEFLQKVLESCRDRLGLSPADFALRPGRSAEWN